MADPGNGPSMEDILSSIKRIISEDGDTASSAPRKSSRAVPAFGDTPHHDEVLELKNPIDVSPARADPAAGIISDATAQATRRAIDMLSRLPAKAEATGDAALEGLIREMLRPMLREWLDANLPAVVEEIVSREIARIVGRPG